MGSVVSGQVKDRHLNRQEKTGNVSLSDPVVVCVSENGFTPWKVSVAVGQQVYWEWSGELSSAVEYNVQQVVHNKHGTVPVPGGYDSGQMTAQSSFCVRFGQAGLYYFISSRLPTNNSLVVHVMQRPAVQVKITEHAFVPNFVEVLQEQLVRWQWDNCEVSYTLQEVEYCFKHGGLVPIATCFKVTETSGTYEKIFRKTGLYYFLAEGTKCGQSLHHLSVIKVLQRHREFHVQLTDNGGIEPTFIKAHVKDRVWLDCSTYKKTDKLDTVLLRTESGSTVVSSALSSPSQSRCVSLVSHCFTEPGIYFYTYKFTDSTSRRGCVMVTPRSREHVIEMTKDGVNPGLGCVATGDRVWWTDNSNAPMFCLTEDTRTSASPEMPVRRNFSHLQGCPCLRHLDKQEQVRQVGLMTCMFDNTGLYTYRVHNGSQEEQTSMDMISSVVVQSTGRHHTVCVTDEGFSPKILNVRPGDQVWWYWDKTERLHDITQVTHQGTLIEGGFVSGTPSRGPTACTRVFCQLGVYYFASSALPSVFGAVVVIADSQVHKLSVGDITPDPLVINSADCVCWIWPNKKQYAIQEIPTSGEIVGTSKSLAPTDSRRAFARVFHKPGVHHFMCTAYIFHEEEQTGCVGDSFINTVIVDPVPYSCVVSVSCDGFNPSAVTVAKSHSILWTWEDRGEEMHSILLVRAPEPEKELVRVRGLSSFDSGSAMSCSTFFHTFDVPGTYYVTSVGSNRQVCRIDVLDQAWHVTMPSVTRGMDGGSVECGYVVHLECDTQQAEIVYTLDGSFPHENNCNLMAYNRKTGIVLRHPGLFVVRALAKKEGWIRSRAYTSRRYWVRENLLEEPMDGMKSKERSWEGADTESLGLREQISNWQWSSCAPVISVTFVTENTIHVNIVLSTTADLSWTRGFQLFLNGVVYGGVFGASCPGLVVSGLTGGKSYHAVLVVYSIGERFKPQLSNEVIFDAPHCLISGAPVVSLEAWTYPNAVIIVWPSCPDPSLGIAAYTVLVNGEQFGEPITTDLNNEYCKVLFESSTEGEDYVICVTAHVEGGDQLLYSNEVQFFLPLSDDVMRWILTSSGQSDAVDTHETIDRSQELLTVVSNEQLCFDDHPVNEKLPSKSYSSNLVTIPEGEMLERTLDQKTESTTLQRTTNAGEEPHNQANEDRQPQEDSIKDQQDSMEEEVDHTIDQQDSMEEVDHTKDQQDSMEEVEHTKDQQDSMEEKVDHTKDQQNSMEEKVDHTKDQQDSMEEVEHTKDQQDSMEEKVDHTKDQQDSMEEKVDHTKDQQDSMEEKVDHTKDQQNSMEEVDHTKDQQDSMEEKVDHTKDQQDSIEENVDHTKDQQNSMEEKVDHTKDQQNSMEEKVDHTKDQQDSMEEVEHTKDQQDSMEEKVDHTKDQQDSMEEKVDHTKDQQDSMEEVDLTKDQQDSIEENVDHTKDQQDSIEEKVDHTKDQQDSIEENVDHTKDQQDSMEERVDHTKDQQDSMEEEVDHTKDQQDSIEEKVDHTKHQQDSMGQPQEDSIKDQQDSMEEEVDHTKDQQDSMEEVDHTKDQQDSMEEKVDHTKDQQDSIEEDVDHIEKQQLEQKECEMEFSNESCPTSPEPRVRRLSSFVEVDVVPSELAMLGTTKLFHSDSGNSDDCPEFVTKANWGSCGHQVAAEIPQTNDIQQRNCAKTRSLPFTPKFSDGVMGREVLPIPHVVVKGTAYGKATVEWVLEPHGTVTSSGVVYEVSVIGSKFTENCNSNTSRNFASSSIKNLWPKQKSGIEEHCWTTEHCVVEILGLDKRHNYRLAVVARFIRPSCVSVSEPVQFIMPWPPEAPSIYVVALNDQQVILGWKRPAAYGEAEIVGYKLLRDGCQFGSVLSENTVRYCVSRLAPGSCNNFILIALTGHSVGDSKPSNVISVSCPPVPQTPEIHVKESFCRGCISLGWKPNRHDNKQPPSSYRVFLDRHFHGSCPAGSVTDILEEYAYCLTECVVGRKYEIYMRAYSAPQIVEGPDGSKLFLCGCLGNTSNVLRVYCAGPPSGPVLRVTNLHEEGILLKWCKPLEYSSIKLARYILRVNNQPHGGMLSADCQNTSITDVAPGQQIRISLTAVTDDLVRKTQEVQSSCRSSGHEAVNSGVESGSSSKQEISNSEAESLCSIGPTLVIYYDCFVKKVNHVYLEKIRCCSVWVSWTVEDDDQSFTYTRIQPECFRVSCLLNGGELIFKQTTTDLSLRLTDLQPHSMYSVTVESLASHPNDQDADSSVEGGFVNTTRSQAEFFHTAQSPGTPANLRVVQTTGDSIKVCWDSPVVQQTPDICLRVNVYKRNANRTQPSVNALNNRKFKLTTEITNLKVDGLMPKTEYIFSLNYFSEDQDSCSGAHAAASMLTASTNGADPPTDLRVVSRSPTSVRVKWRSAVLYGMSIVLHYAVHYVESRHTRKRSRGKSGYTKDASHLLVVDSSAIEAELVSLDPGTAYRVTVQAVLGTDHYLGDDSYESDQSSLSSGMPQDPVPLSCLSDPLTVCTTAPPEKPRLLLSGFSCSRIHLCWSRPCLLAPVPDPTRPNQVVGRVRRLRCYRLEVNGTVVTRLPASKHSFVLKRCKPGIKYSCVLVLVTSPDDDVASVFNRKETQFWLTGTDEEQTGLLGTWDEVESDPLEVTLPRQERGQDWLTGLSAYYSACNESESDEEKNGAVEVEWTAAKASKQMTGFKLIWWSDDGAVNESVAQPFAARTYHITPVSPRSVYNVLLLFIRGDEILNSCGPVQCQIPGSPAAPRIWCRNVSSHQFTVEWNEPRVYGDVDIRGYQVDLGENKKKLLTSDLRRVLVHCQAASVCRVSLVALSSDVRSGDSLPSNQLTVLTPAAAGYSMLGDRSCSNTKRPFSVHVRPQSTTNHSITVGWSVAAEVAHAVAGKAGGYHVVKWSSVLKPQIREKRVRMNECSLTLEDCCAGTSYFIVVAVFDSDGVLVARSDQVTVQTSAPVHKPQLRLRSCLPIKSILEWDRPTTFGDAEIRLYELQINGCLVRDLKSDCTSFEFAEGKPCQEYAFELRVISTKKGCDSQWSDCLQVTCPGAEKPRLRRINSEAVNCIAVAWDKPLLKGGAKVQSYTVYYLNDPGHVITSDIVKGSEQAVVHGPLQNFVEQDRLFNVDPHAVYLVLLHVELSRPDQCASVDSQPIRTRAAVPPDPPVISIQLVGLHQRREVDKTIGSLLHRRDRLLRKSHLLHGSIVVKGSKQKDVEISKVLSVIAELESDLQEALEAIKMYTGTVSALVSWTKPKDDRNAVVTGYQILMNSEPREKLFGRNSTQVQLQVPASQFQQVITVQTLTKHPVGPSSPSDAEVLDGSDFLPSTFFCYFDVHVRGASWPDRGCCSVHDTVAHEASLGEHTKPLAHRGLLTTRIPCPVVSVLDLFDTNWKPLTTAVRSFKPTALLFWTKWCHSSQKLMDFFVEFCGRCSDEFSFVTCCVKSQESGADHCQSVMDFITQKDWVRHGKLLHLCACHSDSQRVKPLRRGVSMVPDVSQLFGLVGVPTVVILDPSGHIAWRGRCCSTDYNTFHSIMLHARAQSLGEQCADVACGQCIMDCFEGRLKRVSECSSDTRTSSKLSQGTLTLHTQLHGGKPREIHVPSGKRLKWLNSHSRSGASVILPTGHGTAQGTGFSLPVGAPCAGLIGKATKCKEPVTKKSTKNVSAARELVTNRKTKKISIDDFVFR